MSGESGFSRITNSIQKGTLQLDRTMARMRGFERDLAKATAESEKVAKAREEVLKALNAQSLAKLRTEELSKQYEKLTGRSLEWQLKNKRKIDNITDLYAQAIIKRSDAIEAFKRSRKSLTDVKAGVVNETLRDLRNRDLRTLYNRTKWPALLGAVGLGWLTATGDSNNPTDASELKDLTGLSLGDSTNEPWTPESHDGFLDNLNYLGDFSLDNPEQYLQGSNGEIYDRLSGQVVGENPFTLEAHNLGYNNIFDYLGAKNGYRDRSSVAQLQSNLGINADGLFGMQTLKALQNQLNNLFNWDPSALELFYQNKVQNGY